MNRTDVIAHCITSVVYLIVVATLGMAGVIDGAAVVAMFLGGGTIVGTLTAADRYSYKRNGDG